MAAALACKLEAPDRIRLGDALVVRCVVTNDSEDDYYVLTWFTPLEGVSSPCLAVWKDGKPVPYDGRLVTRSAEPPPEAYVLIPAGGEVESKVDVTETYPIDAPGRYEIQVATEIDDYATKEEAHDLKARAKVMATAPRRQPLTSKRCVVVVEAGPGLKPTLATKLRQEEAERAAKPEIRAAPSVVHGIIDVFGGDAAQQAAARAAWDAAYVMVNSARVAINSATYNTWFGNPDSGRRERVDGNYAEIKRAMAESGTGTYPPPPKIRYALNLTGDGGCTPGVVAYTYKGFYTIYTCLPFWARPAIGIDSQASTLVHELSHDVVGTDDIVYGTGQAMNLASTNPDQAIRNADNYRFFAGSVPSVDPGPYGFASALPPNSSAESKYQR